MEVACPPVTAIRSMMVTLNLSGCWARVAAHDLRVSVEMIVSEIGRQESICMTSITISNTNIAIPQTLGK